MSAAASPLWSPEQCAWLQALGHEVPVRVREGQDEAEAIGTASRGLPADIASSGAPDQGPPQATRATPDTPLLRALARAAGRPAQDRDLLALLPELASLRGNPAARRALWPRLRALRRQARP